MTRETGPTSSRLPLDWRNCAEATARNLGLSKSLKELPPEHWQKVLAGVETKMRLKGSVLPDRWQSSLAEEVGRSDG